MRRRSIQKSDAFEQMFARSSRRGKRFDVIVDATERQRFLLFDSMRWQLPKIHDLSAREAQRVALALRRAAERAHVRIRIAVRRRA